MISASKPRSRAFIAGLLVSAAAAIAAPPAVRASPAATDTLAPTLAAVGDWISAEFGLSPPRELPQVRFVRPEALMKPAGAGLDPVAAATDPLFAADGPRPAAAYDPRTRVIRLSTHWTGSTIAEMSLLAHEMVHHMQTEAGHRYACAAEREALAYAAQARWLEAYGGSLREEFGIDRMFLLVATTCGM